MQMSQANPSYGDFVRSQSLKNPCFAALAEHLKDKPANGPSTITCLEYHRKRDSSPLPPRNVVVAEVSQLLENADPTISGRILFIEDIQPKLISTLGEALDIDPIFFAGHITTDFSGIEKAPPPPSLALFPSQLVENSYIHVHYQQVIDLGSADEFSGCGYTLETAAGSPRNIRRLPRVLGRQLGLVRVCSSVFVTDLKEAWVCIILVDPPTKSVIGTLKSGARKSFPAKPLQGGFEDFEPFSSITPNARNDRSWDKTSMLATLVHYFRHGHPGHQVKSSIPPEALGEWMLYTHLMSRYVKQYEYSLRSDNDTLHDSDLVDLQRWRRRSKQTQHKLFLLTQFINVWLPREPDSASIDTWQRTLGDIRFLHSQVEYHKNSLEQMVLVATSMVQLREASDVKRLTYIALVFVPLSWVASLFSMSEDFGPGQKWFWVYFATALPLILVLFVFLQLDRLSGLVKRVKGL